MGLNKIKLEKMTACIAALCMIASCAFGMISVFAASETEAKTSEVMTVATAGDLLSIADNPSGTYSLACDIDLYGFCGTVTIPTFSGTLYGNGHCITNYGASLFDVIEADAVIQDLLVVSYGIYGETNVGILAGTLYGTILRCAADGSVFGTSACGGLVGFVSGGTISDSYALGSVSVNEGAVGGLVGKVENSVIERCFSYASVKNKGSSSEAGGLIGTSISSTVSNCYTCSELSGQTFGIGVGPGNVADNSISGMYQQANFDGLDFECVWTIVEGLSTPRLKSISGTGTGSDPYRIRNTLDWIELVPAGLGESGKGKNFKIESDFDIEKLFESEDKSFCGMLDGDNHVLTLEVVGKSLFEVIGESGVCQNVVINQTDTLHYGVFGVVANINYGTIENCHVRYDMVFGRDDFGGIVGENINGTIKRCSFGGSVKMGENESAIGGIAAYNSYGTISECYVKDSTLSGKGYCVGGIVGDNIGGTIENCMTYADDLSAVGGAVGGIAGRLYGGTIENCYASESIEQSDTNGAIVGVLIENGTVENCCYNSELAASAVGNTGSTDGALTAEQTKSTESFDSFDFKSVWTTDSDGDLTLLAISGKGTANNPYLIRYAEEWEAAGDGTASDGTREYYKLLCNLSATNLKESFAGSLDGGGHSIWIASMIYVGSLISTLEPGGYVGNVVLLNAGVSFIGTVDNATIEYCLCSGARNIPFVNNVINSTISHCGRVGCWDSGKSTAIQHIAGGFTDTVTDGSVIESCYVRSQTVNASGYAGGFVGNNSESTISECYVYDTDVTGMSIAGGFVGRNDNGGVIKNCYTNASVAADEYPGAFAGVNYASISGAYANDGDGLSFAALYEGESGDMILSSSGDDMSRAYIRTGGVDISVKDATVNMPEPAVEADTGKDNELTDISGHWAEETIKSLVESGIIDGYEDNTYRPEEGVTKGEFIKLLMSAAECGTSSEFTLYRDVNSSWAREYVSRALELGICDDINIDDTTFGVDEAITRTEAAALVGRLLGSDVTNPSDADTSAAVSFGDDALIPDWARDAVYAAVEAGIITGNGDGTFNPLGSLTRAEAAAIIERVLSRQ